MSRHTKRSSDTGFAALTIEGGLIAPDQVQAIASAAPDQKTAADYGCPKGTGLRDEITRYFRIAQAHWQGYARLEQPTMQQTAEFARNLLEQAFGFELTGPHHHTREDRRFTIAWEAKGGRVPIVVSPPAPADKGKAGDALIFWNLSAAGEREPFSLHGGLPVIRGEKWLLSQWVRQRPTPLR